jgi:hypothetical protein
MELLGGRVSSSERAARISLDRIVSRYGASHNLRDGWDAPAFDLRGSQHTLSNSTIAHVSSAAVILRGNNHLISNNVIYDTGFILASSDGIQVSNSVGSSIQHNTIFDAGAIAISAATLQAGSVTHNRVYRIGTQESDLAAINAWNGGDGQGTQIAYNLVHDVVAYYDTRDPATPHWGGAGIRLDSGGAPQGNSNYTLHHNVVFRTTAASMAVWGLLPSQLNYGNTGIQVYNNTLDGDLRLAGSGADHTGTTLHNNIVLGHLGIPASHTAQISQNLLHNNQLADNLHGSARLINRASGNFLLRPDSPAINTGATLPPFTDGFVGAAPDMGAFEHGEPPFVAGALLRPEDLAALEVQCDTEHCTLTDLPTGRHLPANFVLRVGEQTSADCITLLDQATDTLHGRCALSNADGSYSAAASLDGDQFTPLPAPVVVRSIFISTITPASALIGTRPLVTIRGGGFHGGSATRIPLTLHGDTADLEQTPQPLWVDTAQLIRDGLLANDCRDLSLEESAGVATYLIWVESGCNTAQTLVWVQRKPGSAPLIGPMPAPQLWLTRDPAAQHRRELIFPALHQPGVQVWIAANDLAEASVATWKNRATSSIRIAQPDPTAQPILRPAQIGALPTVAFDGSNDHFALGDALGADRYGAVFVVYRNPEPGASTWQRIYSSLPAAIGNDYEHNGAYAIPPNDGSGVIIPQATAQLNVQYYNPTTWDGRTLDPRDMRNFMVARKNNADLFFKGEIAELIVVNTALSLADRVAITRYLELKYALTPTPQWDVAYNTAQPPMQVQVGDAECVVEAVQSSEELRCWVAARTEPGSVSVSVRNAAGAEVLEEAAFAYVARVVQIFLPLLR